MSLKERINEELKTAMKAKDADRLNAIRSLRAELLKKEKEKAGSEADDEAILAMVKRLVKQRKESIEMFSQNGREADAAKEEAELKVLEEFLPEELSEAELDAIIAEVIAAAGASSAREMGPVMGQVMGRCKKTGKNFDGKEVNVKVRSALGG
ncbi:GatB/YqeY domain-containing protein [Candidatus Sumerlaeota bacterium]|nr:GatB/YqeY domain-containing protein [Candidatus Sumerlaeota bacterium]